MGSSTAWIGGIFALDRPEPWGCGTASPGLAGGVGHRRSVRRVPRTVRPSGHQVVHRQDARFRHGNAPPRLAPGRGPNEHGCLARVQSSIARHASRSISSDVSPRGSSSKAASASTHSSWRPVTSSLQRSSTGATRWASRSRSIEWMQVREVFDFAHDAILGSTGSSRSLIDQSAVRTTLERPTFHDQASSGVCLSLQLWNRTYLA